MATLASHALIVGCGYLGQTLARRLIDAGATVFGTTRTHAHATRLSRMGVRPMLVSVTRPVTFAALRPAIEAPALDVYYMIPPGKPGSDPSPRKVVLGGVAHMVKQLRHARVRRAVLVSSTAVYGQRDGQRVDADTDPQPNDPRGELMLTGERLWLDAGAAYHVVRLAGLYGLGRVIGLAGVRDQSPIVGDGQALLNVIHVEDAAELLLAVMRADNPGRVELGCDGRPVPRIAYYQHLASLIGAPPPQVLDPEAAAERFGLSARRLRSASSKALDHIVTCQRTGWSPRYPSYKDGVEAAIAASGSGER